jgi:hypothetical protein
MPDLPVAAFVDIAIVLVLLELVALAAASMRGAGAISALAFVPNLVSGLALMVALRLAIGGAAAPWIVAALAVSGVGHVADLAGRWRGRKPAAPARSEP